MLYIIIESKDKWFIGGTAIAKDVVELGLIEASKKNRRIE